ncbi:MAG: hypothetical protein CL926_13650 [Deltaproteobacteria bacterium]|nr:hypothetical protein [Deltaproteobacteria bacterium]
MKRRKLRGGGPGDTFYALREKFDDHFDELNKKVIKMRGMDAGEDRDKLVTDIDLALDTAQTMLQEMREEIRKQPERTSEEVRKKIGGREKSGMRGELQRMEKKLEVGRTAFARIKAEAKASAKASAPDDVPGHMSTFEGLAKNFDDHFSQLDKQMIAWKRMDAGKERDKLMQDVELGLGEAQTMLQQMRGEIKKQPGRTSSEVQNKSDMRGELQRMEKKLEVGRTAVDKAKS